MNTKPSFASRHRHPTQQGSADRFGPFNASTNKVSMQIITIFLAIGLLLFPVPTGATTADPDLTAGRTLLQQGRFEAAYDHLFAAFLEHPDAPEINFLLGRAAYEKGDYEAAVMAFDRVLIVDPSAMRVRLELARCYLALNNLETARQLLLQVRGNNPPDTVKNNIDTLLLAIEQGSRRHALHGNLALGCSLDDNVRTAPTDDLIRIYLNNTILATRPQRPENDTIYAATLTLDHTYLTDRQGLSWQSSWTGYQSRHQFADDQDISYLALQSGPSWQHGNSALKAQPLVAMIDLDGHRYLSVFGIESAWSWAPRANHSRQLGLKLTSNRYHQDHGRDSISQTWFLNEFLQRGNNRYFARLAAGFENAQDDSNSNRSLAINLRADHDLSPTLSAFASLGYTDSRYDDTHPLFLNRRHDRETVVTGGVRKRLWQQPANTSQLFMEAADSYTAVDSTIALYEYHRNVFSLLFTLTF